MPDLSDMPVPSFAPAFRLVATAEAEIEVGRLATGGVRRCRSYSSGRFEGRGTEGMLVSGGETLLARSDGVTVVEAVFVVQTRQGAILRLVGTGYETARPFAGLRLTFAIEADEDGPHAAMTTRAFAAERVAGADILHIFEIE